jgi:hypothetical protein
MHTNVPTRGDMMDDHDKPCALAQVLESRVDQLYRHVEVQNAMILTIVNKLDLVIINQAEERATTKTRLDHIEKGMTISNTILDTHVDQSEEYRKKVELCDGFRTSAQWGIGILFTGVVGQFILSIADLLHKQ